MDEFKKHSESPNKQKLTKEPARMRYHVYLYCKCPPRDVHHGTVLEVSRQLGAFYRGAHQDHSEVPPHLKKLLKNDEKEVRLHATLVDLTTKDSRKVIY